MQSKDQETSPTMPVISEETWNLFLAQSQPSPRYPKPVIIGGYEVWAAGGIYLNAKDLRGYDLLVPLTSMIRFEPGKRYQILALPMEDFGGATGNFASHIASIAEELRRGTRMLIFCDGGMGRTGTVLSSLVALMEPQVQDPIAAIRERYFNGAVETYAQVSAVFALKGKATPRNYQYMEELDHYRRSLATRRAISVRRGDSIQQVVYPHTHTTY